MLRSLGWAEHGETSSPALRATPWLPRLRFPELIVREVCSQQGECAETGHKSALKLKQLFHPSGAGSQVNAVRSLERHPQAELWALFPPRFEGSPLALRSPQRPARQGSCCHGAGGQPEPAWEAASAGDVLL